MAKTITAAEFESEVLKSDIPVLVDFYANWCGPCKMIAPTIDELAEEYAGRVKILKVDTDDCGSLDKTYGVRSIPTLIFFKNGEKVETHVGVLGKMDLAAKLDGLL